MKPRFGIYQKSAGGHDNVSFVQAVDDLNAIADLPTGFYRPRLEMILRGLDEDPIFEARVKHCVSRHAKPGGQRDGKVDIDEHAGTKLEPRILRIDAHLRALGDRADVRQEA